MKKQESSILQEIFQIDSLIKRNNYDYYSINSLPMNKMIDSLITKNNWLGIFWRQLFRLSPINLRTIFRQNANHKDPKAMILLSLAYLELWNCYKDIKYLESFEYCINWVISHRSNMTRYFAIPQLKKILVKGYKTDEKDISPFLTFWAGFLFLESYKYLGNQRYLDLADSVGKYFIDELPRSENENVLYFYYVPNHQDKVRIYNCSALISAYLLKLSSISLDSMYLKYGKKGIQYIINVQNQDGSWFYGNNKFTRYIDNFHTAFIIFALYEAKKYYNNNELKRSFKLGLSYYENKLLKKISNNLIRPIHFDARYLPPNSNFIQKVDLRDSALSIILFSILSKESQKYSEYANNILNWTVKNMKGKIGYYCELTWLWPNKIPYIEFQAWIVLSLSIYLKFVYGVEK